MIRRNSSVLVCCVFGCASIASIMVHSCCSSTAVGEELPKVIANKGKTKMKIAPYTKRWNEGETDWSFVENPSDQITAWEKVQGITLPKDYRDFLVRYNGGRVYPRMFKHKMGSLQAGPFVDDSGETYLDLLYPWETVEMHWQGKTYGKGVPSQHIVIGENPGGIQVIMSLTPQDKGKIYSWFHSRTPWGTEENTKKYPLADSFSEFLKNLYDNGNDYDDWHIPLYDTLARELE